VRVDLRLQVGDLLLHEGNGIGAGSPPKPHGRGTGARDGMTILEDPWTILQSSSERIQSSPKGLG
jgi:hypothetical protein